MSGHEHSYSRSFPVYESPSIDTAQAFAPVETRVTPEKIFTPPERNLEEEATHSMSTFGPCLRKTILTLAHAGNIFVCDRSAGKVEKSYINPTAPVYVVGIASRDYQSYETPHLAQKSRSYDYTKNTLDKITARP